MGVGWDKARKSLERCRLPHGQCYINVHYYYESLYFPSSFLSPRSRGYPGPFFAPFPVFSRIESIRFFFRTVSSFASCTAVFMRIGNTPDFSSFPHGPPAGPASLAEIPPFLSDPRGRRCLRGSVSGSYTVPAASRCFSFLLAPHTPSISKSAPPPRHLSRPSPLIATAAVLTRADDCDGFHPTCPQLPFSSGTPHPIPFSFSQPSKTPSRSPHLK